MPLHARPTPAPPNVPGGPTDRARSSLTLTFPPDAPPEVTPPEGAPEPAPVEVTPAAVREMPVAPSAPARAWYRREPWLVAMVAAFVPMALGLALPQAFHLPLAGISALLVILSTAMLVRQGPFREHPHAADAPRRRA